MHYTRKYRGKEMAGGHKRKAYDGQPRLGKDGYVSIYVPGDPHARQDGWAFEHRVVMANHIGRPLLDKENVHHRNGIRSNNNIENLELWTCMQPSGQRATDALRWARQVVALYGPLAATDLI
jgi:HNH endonuclease